MPRRRRRSRARRKSQSRRPSTGVRAALLAFLRRRSTKWLIAAILTLTLGIVLGLLADDGDGDESGADAVPSPTLAVTLPDLQPDRARLEEGEVLRVIDGDTIDVRIGGRGERVRYFGVDTPERGEPCFDEATARNEALVGEAVLLLPDTRQRDPFDRLLRYIFTEDGLSVDARLIAEGLGTAWREDGAYRDELVALEAEVRAADAGCLWGE